MLLCADRLSSRLPADTELWLVGTGSEEDGCNGMHAFVDQHRDWPKEQSYFVNFECVGGGSMHYIRSESMLSRSAYPATFLELARRIAAGGAFGSITPTDLLAATDGHVPAERDYPTLSLICLEKNGVPRNYHRIE
ncbi:MAG: M28 family peptidase, partial [Proteobacteria bacterium]|nr:M28 family peptidase [Pseudomonadota bacterium]